MSRSAATLTDFEEATSVIVSEAAFVRGVQLAPAAPSPIHQLVQQITDLQNRPDVIAEPHSLPMTIAELREFRRQQGRSEHLARPWNNYGMWWPSSTF